MGELEDVSKKLGIKLNDRQKKNICVLLDYYLREYDATKKEGKRWFLNSIEGMKMRAGWVKK